MIRFACRTGRVKAQLPAPPPPPVRHTQLSTLPPPPVPLYRRHDSHLLASEELQLLDAYSGLPAGAQCLLLRLSLRVGPWFALPSLDYPECGDVQEAAAALVGSGLALRPLPDEWTQARGAGRGGEGLQEGARGSGVAHTAYCSCALHIHAGAVHERYGARQGRACARSASPKQHTHVRCGAAALQVSKIDPAAAPCFALLTQPRIPHSCHMLGL